MMGNRLGPSTRARGRRRGGVRENQKRKKRRS
jgi:hypothetical protein